MATEYKLSYTAQEIDERLGEIDNIVKYTEQVIAEEQKEQARTNIGAVGIEEVQELINNTLGVIENGYY